MEKSFGLLFYHENPKNFEEGQRPVYLRITVNGISSEICTKRKCDYADWNNTAGRMDGKTEDLLRERALQKLRKQHPTHSKLSPQDLEHELNVHETGPLMQNEEMLASQQKLKASLQNMQNYLNCLRWPILFWI